MVALPASIETALMDAGFSGTEIVVLRKLLEEEGLTLRELASKTGKSTGVLDQATKKLVRKGIIAKQDFNGTSKFVLHSVSAISKWMAQDMQEKREMLSRKFKNFETFIATIEVDKKRPEIEFFDGIEGIHQAYQKLLTYGRKELLHFIPVQTTAEEDPLRDFRVQFFRDRRSHGVFSRVIAHNTPLGRRYQSRDPFEYRKTLLVDEKEYPFNFEKVIVNGTVACFHVAEQRACFIKFPEFAENERLSFESMWARGLEQEKSQVSTPASVPVASQPSLSTKTFSALREFFLGKKSIVTMLVLALVSAGITVGLYLQTSAMNLQRMKDRVQAIAATAAFQFDARDLDQLRVESDWKKPQWAKVVNQLREIRQSNEHILFTYIVRRTAADPTKGEFVADSHSLNPYANVDDDPQNDINVGYDDGVFDPEGAEELQWPGMQYDSMPQEAFDAYAGPTTTASFYEDQWGHVLSGYAPIKDARGQAVAVMAVDMEYQQLGEFNAQTFKPLLYFVGFFLLFILIRLFAFNRSLFQEMLSLARTTRIRWYVPVILVALVLAVVGVRYYSRQKAIHTVGLRMQAIAATAAADFSDLDLNSLRKAEDMKTETYQKAYALLNEIRYANPEVRFAYIFRKTDKHNIFEFVVDADSNYFIQEMPFDANFDRELDQADEIAYPGKAYDITNAPGLLYSVETGLPTYDLGADQWGDWISGVAPILNSNGNLTGIVGVDFDKTKIGEQ